MLGTVSKRKYATVSACRLDGCISNCSLPRALLSNAPTEVFAIRFACERAPSAKLAARKAEALCVSTANRAKWTKSGICRSAKTRPTAMLQAPMHSACRSTELHESRRLAHSLAPLPAADPLTNRPTLSPHLPALSPHLPTLSPHLPPSPHSSPPRHVHTGRAVTRRSVRGERARPVRALLQIGGRSGSAARPVRARSAAHGDARARTERHSAVDSDWPPHRQP